MGTIELFDEGGRTRQVLTWGPLDASPDEVAALEAGKRGAGMGFRGALDCLEELLAGL